MSTNKQPGFPVALRKLIGVILLFGTIGLASCEAALHSPARHLLGV